MGIRPQVRVSQVSSLPAPLGGLNDIDPLAAMGEQYCVSLVNWFPNTASLDLRSGYREWATGLGGKVYSMMNYFSTDNTQKLFACTNTDIFDVTSSTDAPVSVASISYGVMNHVNYSNVYGTYLVACNGVDPALLYNGTDWIPFTESATPAAPGEIDGVDPSVLTGVTSHQKRLWFIQQDSMTCWYLDVDAVGGVAKPFYFGSLFKRGGSIAQIATWSFDSGEGLDDKLVVHTTAGEVAVYSGSDPDDATSWQLDAVFFVSAPIGTKANSELGGDVLLLTRAGIVPLSTVVKGSLNTATTESTLSNKISKTLSRLANSSIHVPDWEILNIPGLQATVILLPPVPDGPAMQFVMNNLTGAWTRYDLPATCGALLNGKFFFGGVDGVIYRYGDAYLDGIKLDGSGGTARQGNMFTAYNYFGDKATNKHYKMIRPIFQSTTRPSFKAVVNVDYDLASLPGNPLNPNESQYGSLWDAGIWDASFWSSTNTVFRPWTTVVGMGFCAALLMKVAATEALSFTALEVVLEPGRSI